MNEIINPESSYGVGALHQYSVEVGGQALTIEVFGWYSDTPLMWRTLCNEEVLIESDYFQAPGLPILEILDDNGLALENGIPEAVLSFAKLFPEYSFQIIQACADHSSCASLLENSPLTFISTISFAVKNELTKSDYLTLIHLKKREILQLLGFDNTSIILKFEQQLGADNINREVVENLKKLSSNRLMLLELRHIPANQLTVCSVQFAKQILASELPIALVRRLHQEITYSNLNGTISLIKDTFNMANNLDVLMAITSLQQLHNVHNRLITRLLVLDKKLQFKSLHERYGPYPPSCFNNTKHIYSICSWDELIEEGQCMRHCITSYSDRIANRSYVVFRVDCPERLTVGIKLRNGAWQLDDVRGYMNSTASDEALEAIKLFLANENTIIKG